MINQDENQIENSIFLDPFSKEVWESTYKYHEDKSVLDTFRRVARAIASVEATEELRKEWEEKFFDLLNDFKITAGGRIYSNAGTNFKGTTAVNCFVGPKPDHDQDSLEGIFKVLLWQAQTLKSEGGWGMNFSFIRPRGSYIHGIGVESPGAVKYMEIFDKVSDVITSGSGKKNSKKEGKGKIRKGAMMGCLSVNHPDIEEFIEAKLQQGRLTKFNLSVQCTNDFMDLIDSLKSAKARGDEEFVKNNDVWKLEFPDTTHPNYKTEWDGNFAKWRGKGYNMITHKTVSALGLWEKIMKSTYTRNDPGVLFTDIANKTHCWNYGENSYIAVSNPCQPKWATVLTPDGISTFDKVNVGDKIWSKEGWTKIVNKWSTGVKDVYEYKTENNSVFNGTENHRLVSNGEKVEARLCEVIDCFGEIKKNVFENIKVGVYTHNVFETNPSKIVSRKFISSEEVFDITVDNESHTYWTGGCNVSNCLAAGTLVNTPFGCKKIEDIKEGDLVSTLHPSGSEPVKTVERHAAVEVFEVKFSDGGVQYATAAHIYHVQKKKSGKKFIEKLRLDELELGDCVQVEPVKRLDSSNFNQNDYETGYIFGTLLGDGSISKITKVCSNIDDEKWNENIKKLFEKHGFSFVADNFACDGSKSVSLCLNSESSNKIKSEFFSSYTPVSENKYIPLEYMNNYSKLCGVINGLLSTDGNVNLKTNHPQIRFNTSSETLALNVRSALISLGVHGRITKSFKQDGGEINGRKIVRKHTRFVINISGFDFKNLASICYNNLHPEKAGKIKKALFNAKLSGNSRSAAIVSIKSVGQKEVFDLFCEESDTWITDGYVQQGCGEQLLPFGAICNLSSLNLTQFINSDNTGFDMDKIRKYVAYAVRFLDNVNSYTNTPLEQYKDSAENRRRIGLGVMGWGSALYILKVPFASDRAEQIKNDLMRVFTDTAIETSVNLAIEKGTFRDCDKEKHANAYYWKQINLRESLVEKIRQNGIRNSALFSIQPTGNTSILANVVSGGIEPVFLPQYIRTVIVANPPDDVKDITPKYWEGDFTPNSTFISVKEGGDDVLRAEINGTVYKIDKGRGLTKEVLCLDYGVRKLKERGEWDEKADWAKTALSIGVNEHVRDMRGWAFWIDSAISKTCNLPSDYPYEQFEDLYLNAYKTGIIKGITTYRDGTMAPVLSAEKPVDNIISADGRPQGKLKKNSAPKRGKALKGDFYHILSKGVKYYAAVGFMDDDPYEIFTGLNSNSEGDAIFPKTLSSGEIVKHAGGKYAFRAPNGIEYPLTSAFSDPNVDALTRMISTSLRHGVSIEFVVQQLEKTKGEFSSFAKILGRTLKHYIKDGKKSGKKCSECGGDLVYSEGCLKCSNCGYSKCG